MLKELLYFQGGGHNTCGGVLDILAKLIISFTDTGVAPGGLSVSRSDVSLQNFLNHASVGPIAKLKS